MRRRSAKVLVGTGLLAVLAGGCEEGTGPGVSTISVVQATLRDTVRAINPLVVVVRGRNGTLASHVDVRFQTTSAGCGIFDERANDSVFSNFALAPTYALDRA